ncbi:MAG TPA: peptidyl-prolyl cis-trans isomerase [Terriglobales bacterium]|nr:peptidyl-prolyl cis-trans isomerase [Terriglobales bacterium]
MIKFLQKGGKTQKWLFGILLTFVCITMVWYLVPGGMNDPTGTPQQGDVATVGDEKVSALDVEQTARNMAKQQFRGQVPEQVLPLFMRSAAEQLIEQKALVYEARRAGFDVTEAELRDVLRQGQFGEMFFPGGNFIGQEAYENAVQNYFQLGVQQFEEKLREQLLWQKLLSMATTGVAVSDAEIAKEFARQNVKVKLEYAVLTNADVEKLIKPTDAELKKYFEDNKSRYAGAIPEKRKANYIVIDRQKVLEQAKQSINDQQLLAYYNAHQDQYRTPEQVRVRHILIETPQPGPDGKVDQKAVDAARAKAADIAKQVRSGANFAELAKKYSADPGSKDKGGEIGWVTPTSGYVPEFIKGSLALNAGQTSDPVQSAFGFHVIQAEEKKPAGVKPFNEVKDQIAQALAQDKAATELDALAAKVQSQAATEGIDKAAANNHVQAFHSEWFTRTDNLPGVGNAADFMQAVFTAKLNSDPVSVRVPAGYAIAVPTEDQPAKTPTFEEWRSHVEQDFKQAQSTALLAQRSHELADRAHAEHDLKKAAKELGATLKTSDPVTMSGQVPNIGAMSGPASVAFDMQPGEISNAIDTGAGAVVFTVLEKQQPSANEAAQGREQTRETLLQQKRQQRLSMFIADVRSRLEKQGKIKINQAELNRISGGSGSPLSGM